jgi:predicted Zn finger-like uncharacterized protein
MKISCEECKILFKVDDKNLSSDGITCLCPKCKHPHLVKRIVIPLGESDKKILKPEETSGKNVPPDQEKTVSDDSITKTDNEPTIQKMMSTDMKGFQKLSDQAQEEKMDLSKITPYVEKEKEQHKQDNQKITLEKPITLGGKDGKKKEEKKINLSPPKMPDPSLSMDTEEPNTMMHKANPLTSLMFQFLLGFIIILGVIFTMYLLRVL